MLSPPFRPTRAIHLFKTSFELPSVLPQEVPQPIYVIGAGLPRTGTASFVVALQKLGLLSYHMKDGVMETPGHLDMWHDLYAGSVSFDDVLNDMAAYGFNATCDVPTSL